MTGTTPRIGFVGMTHLGLNSAAAAAEKGFETTGFDPDAGLTERLAAGRLPVSEPELDDLVARNATRLSFASDPAALAACDVIYVAPDVPTDDHGNSDLAGIEGLLALALEHAAPEATVVILSQVPPGFTRRRLPARGNLYYQVETLIFGRAVERALYPERFIVGCPDPAAPLPAAFAAFLAAFGCPVLPMRLESAELAKISINCCLVASISTANTLAAICEGIGADWAEIAPALKLDKRIGQFAYLKPGLGIAGGNLERDLQTVVALGRETASDVGVVQAWQANSQHRRDWALEAVHRHVLAGKPDAAIAILGLAYKENTHSTKNSAGLALAQQLGAYGPAVHDPLVGADAIAGLGVRFAVGIDDAIKGADAVVVMTPWADYAALSAAGLKAAMAGTTVIDPYAVLDGKACIAAGLAYHTLGKPAVAPAAGDA